MTLDAPTAAVIAALITGATSIIVALISNRAKKVDNPQNVDKTALADAPTNAPQSKASRFLLMWAVRATLLFVFPVIGWIIGCQFAPPIFGGVLGGGTGLALAAGIADELSRRFPS
jgi:hypothetical protein